MYFIYNEHNQNPTFPFTCFSLVGGFLFQMDLTQRIAIVASVNIVSVDTLEVGKQYLILHAEKQSTCSGWMTLLQLRENANRDIHVILPYRYNDALALKDVADIDSKSVVYDLFYRRRFECGGPNSVIF